MLSTEDLIRRLIREVRLANHVPQPIPERTLQELKLQIQEDENAVRSTTAKSRSDKG